MDSHQGNYHTNHDHELKADHATFLLFYVVKNLFKSTGQGTEETLLENKAFESTNLSYRNNSARRSSHS